MASSSRIGLKLKGANNCHIAHMINIPSKWLFTHTTRLAFERTIKRTYLKAKYWDTQNKENWPLTVSNERNWLMLLDLSTSKYKCVAKVT